MLLLKIFKNRRFPRWAGPLVGVMVGGYCGLQNPFVPGALPVWMTMAGGAIMGGLAGSLVIFLDPRSSDVATEGLPEHLINASQTPSGLVGRVLSLFGLLLCWTPFLGPVLNLIGVWVNCDTDDWALVVSKIGFVVGAIVSLVTLIGLILGW